MKPDKNILKKYQALIIQVLVIVVSVVVIGLVLYPQLNDYWANRGKADELNRKTQIIHTKVQTLQGVDQARTEQDLKVVLTVLPKDQNVMDSIAQIQNLIAASGLGITNLSYGSEAKSAGDSFNISLELAGQLQNMTDLLKRLSTAPRIIQVASISIQGSNTSNDITVPFVVYFKPPPSGNILEDQPVSNLTEADKNLLSNLGQGVATPNVGSASASPASIQLGKTDPFN